MLVNKYSKLNRKPKFPTLPTVKADGNANPAGNRLGGVGNVPALPTPETVVGAQTQTGDFRTTAPGAGSQPTVQASAPPTEEKRAYYDPRLGRVVVPGDPQWSGEGAKQYATPAAAPQGVAPTTTVGVPPAAGEKPATFEDTPEGQIRGALASGLVTASQVAGWITGHATAGQIRQLLVGAGIKFKTPQEAVDLANYLAGLGVDEQGKMEFLESIAPKTTPPTMAPGAVSVIGKVAGILAGGKSAFVTAGATTDEEKAKANLDFVLSQSPADVDAHALTGELTPDDYFATVQAMVQAGVKYPKPADKLLAGIWERAGGREVVGAAGAPTTNAALHAAWTAEYEAVKAGGFAAGSTLREPDQLQGYDYDAIGNLVYMGGTAFKEDPAAKEVWEQDMNLWRDANNKIKANTRLVSADTQATLDQQKWQFEEGNRIKEKEWLAAQEAAKKKEEADKRLLDIQEAGIYVPLLLDMISSPRGYAQAKASGILDWVMGKLSGLGITDIDFKPPKPVDIDAARRYLSDIDAVRKWGDAEWTQAEIALGMSREELWKLFAEMTGQGAIGGGAQITTRRGEN